jgi:hypothetical protein
MAVLGTAIFISHTPSHPNPAQPLGALSAALKGIVSPDWKGLQMVSLDRFEV